MSVPVAHVAELWRYPVKGMRGEQVESLDVLADGIAHDRRFAFESSGAPAGKPLLTSRERAAMLLYAASVSANGAVVTTPEGETFPVTSPALQAYLEARLPQANRVALKRAGPPLTDVRPIAMLSTRAAERISEGYGQSVDPRRFRANLVLRFTPEALAERCGDDGKAFPEDGMSGQTVQIGETCRLRVLERIPRCRMVTLDPETTAADPALMKYLDGRHGGRVGVYAAVETAGPVRRGDAITLLTPRPFPRKSRPMA